MSLLKMPEGVVKSLESIQSRFLWGGSDLKRKLHMVAWAKINQGTKSGGLGMRNIRTISKPELATPPPLPILPLPSYSQLKWQQREIIMFLHFGVNTFTNSKLGMGKENPAIFNSTGLNAAQWVETAVEAGASLVILTAKHHDGFCLWPSKYTDYSVIGSPWKNGHGDVIRELLEAAKHRSVDVGLYLLPLDLHDRRYGHDKEYNEYYLAQLQELLNK